MKNFLLTVFLISSFQISNAEPPQRIGQLGLIAELSYIKNSSESYIMQIMADTGMKASDRLQCVHMYNALRIHYDQVTTQLIADLRNSNRTRSYRQLDDVLTQKAITHVSTDEFMSDKLIAYLAQIVKGAEMHGKFLQKADSLIQMRGLIFVPSIPALKTTVSGNIINTSERLALMLGEVRLRGIEEMVGRK